MRGILAQGAVIRVPVRAGIRYTTIGPFVRAASHDLFLLTSRLHPHAKVWARGFAALWGQDSSV